MSLHLAAILILVSTARGSHILILVSTLAARYAADFLMAEFEFVLAKKTFDDKLKVVEIAGC